jgi:hypothetical protein
MRGKFVLLKSHVKNGMSGIFQTFPMKMYIGYLTIPPKL